MILPVIQSNQLEFIDFFKLIDSVRIHGGPKNASIRLAMRQAEWLDGWQVGCQPIQVQILKRRAETLFTPQGAKLHGQWFYHITVRGHEQKAIFKSISD